MLTRAHKDACLYALALFTACFALFDKVEPWVQGRLEGSSLPGAEQVLVRTAWIRERLGLARALARLDDAVSPLFSETYKNRHAYAENEAATRLSALARGGRTENAPASIPAKPADAGFTDRDRLQAAASDASGGSPASPRAAQPQAQVPPQSSGTPATPPAPTPLASLPTQALAQDPGVGRVPAPEALLTALGLAGGKVLVAGDSLSLALGLALEKALKPRADFSVVQRGKLSSGLLNPQFFNWVQAMGDFLPEHRPSLVIVMMGGNDAKYLSVQEDQGRVEAVGDRRLTSYRERLGRFLAVLDRFAIPCLWVGLPVMGDEEYDKQCQVLNSEVKKAIESSKWTRFLDTRRLLADDNGRYAQYAQLPNSGRVRIREMDKVHFNVAGGGILVAHMAPEVAKLMEKHPAQARRVPSRMTPGPVFQARNIAEMDALPQ